jgi:hypothetical protein
MREPIVVTEHGTKVFCEVGDKALDIQLPHPDGTVCSQCRADIAGVRQVAMEQGLLRGDEN